MSEQASVPLAETNADQAKDTFEYQVVERSIERGGELTVETSGAAEKSNSWGYVVGSCEIRRGPEGNDSVTCIEGIIRVLGWEYPVRGIIGY